MKRVSLLLPIFLSLLFSSSAEAQSQAHYKHWGEPQDSVAVRYWKSDHMEVENVESNALSVCYDYPLIETRNCHRFNEEGRYYSYTSTSKGRTMKAASKQIIDHARTYGSPVKYMADQTEVNDAQQAFALAESWVEIVFPPDDTGTQSIIRVATNSHPEDRAGTHRVSTTFRDTELTSGMP